ncbi:MAG: hypothetical protein LUQ59_10710 [Methanothrix sp.]|nr:hypothetical protein [Methanothrix sp.]
MRMALVDSRSAPDVGIGGSMDEGDIDFEPASRNWDEFRRMIVDNRKSIRLSAG